MGALAVQRRHAGAVSVLENHRRKHPPRRSAAENEELREAARLADIHDPITGFPSAYSTLVGERGVTLSGGQRQRVALARALLQDTPVLLLDDALSAGDAETESTILEAVRSRHGRRTTLVIAHRLSTLAHADKVIVLEKGCIIQHGTHAELAEQDGLYGRLWTIQNALENEMFSSSRSSSACGFSSTPQAGFLTT